MELQYLTYLNLSFNYFENSSIPQFLGSLTHLTHLDLRWCTLGGHIPTQLGLLSHLQYLDLSGNLVEGEIPSQLGNLFQLQYLDLIIAGAGYQAPISRKRKSSTTKERLKLDGNLVLGLQL